MSDVRGCLDCQLAEWSFYLLTATHKTHDDGDSIDEELEVRAHDCPVHRKYLRQTN